MEKKGSKKGLVAAIATIAVIAVIVILIILQSVGKETPTSTVPETVTNKNGQEIIIDTSDIESELAGILAELDNMKVVVDANKNSLSQIEINVDSIDGDTTEAIEKLTNITKNLTNFVNEQKIENETIKATLAEIIADLDASTKAIMENDNNNTTSINNNLTSTREKLEKVIKELSEQETKHHEELMKTLKEDYEALDKLINDSSKELKEELEKDYNALDEKLDATNKNIDDTRAEVIDLLNTIKGNIEDNQEEIVSRFDKVDSDIANLRSKMEEMLTDIQNMISALSEQNATEHAATIEKLTNMGTSIEELNQSLENTVLNKISTTKTDILNALNNDYAELSNQLTIINQDVNEQFGSLNSTVNNMNTALTSFQTSSNNDDEAIKKKLDDLNSYVNSVFQSVSSGKRLIASALLTKEWYSQGATYKTISEINNAFGINIVDPGDTSRVMTFEEIRQAIKAIPQDKTTQTASGADFGITPVAVLYDGQPHTVKLGVPANSTVYAGVTRDNVQLIDSELRGLPSFKEVGEYDVYVVMEYVKNGEQVTARVNSSVIILQRDIADAVVTLSDYIMLYDGEEKEPAISSVFVDDMELELGKDFDVEYLNNIETTSATSKAQVKLTGKGNFTGTIEVDFEIQKIKAEYKEVPTGILSDYTGEAQSLIIDGTGTTDDGVVVYSLDGESWSQDVPTATDAGEYTVFYYIYADKNHSNSAIHTVTATINKVEAEMTTEPSGLVLDFNETEQTLVSDAQTSDGTIMYSVDGGQTFTTSATAMNAGEYVVYYYIVGDKNHTDSTIKTTAASINKVKAEFDFAPTLRTLQYTGENQELVIAGTTNDGTVKYSLDGHTFDSALPVAKEIGEYTVYCYIEGDENHTDSDVMTVTTEIRYITVIYEVKGVNYARLFDATTENNNAIIDSLYSLGITDVEGFVGWSLDGENVVTELTITEQTTSFTLHAIFQEVTNDDNEDGDDDLSDDSNDLDDSDDSDDVDNDVDDTDADADADADNDSDDEDTPVPGSDDDADSNDSDDSNDGTDEI